MDGKDYGWAKFKEIFEEEIYNCKWVHLPKKGQVWVTRARPRAAAGGRAPGGDTHTPL